MSSVFLCSICFFIHNAIYTSGKWQNQPHHCIMMLAPLHSLNGVLMLGSLSFSSKCSNSFMAKFPLFSQNCNTSLQNLKSLSLCVLGNSSLAFYVAFGATGYLVWWPSVHVGRRLSYLWIMKRQQPPSQGFNLCFGIYVISGIWWLDIPMYIYM